MTAALQPRYIRVTAAANTGPCNETAYTRLPGKRTRLRQLRGCAVLRAGPQAVRAYRPMRVDRVADGDADAQNRCAVGRRVRRSDRSASGGSVGSAAEADDGGAYGSRSDARADDRHAVGVADDCRADARAD